MKTVILGEFIFRTKDAHTASHGIDSGKALQYYGGQTGMLISYTPIHNRIISSEIVRVDIKTKPSFTLMKSPLLKFI